MFIRTITDRNSLNIVVEVSNDVDYVNSTAFEWTEIPNQDVNIGDYYYNDSVIHVNSPEYDSIISPIVFAGEEEFKKQQGLSVPETPVEEDPVVTVSASPPTIEVEPATPSADLPPPMLPDYSNEPLTEENLREWEKTNANVSLYLNRLKGKGVTFVNNKVTFSPPLEYPGGTVQSEFYAVGHTSLNDLISYIEQVNTLQTNLIERIKRQLNIQ